MSLPIGLPRDHANRIEILACMALYEHDIRNFFLRRLYPHRQDAEDLAQEVWERLLQQKRQTKVDDPKNYLFGVARHTLAAFLTKRKRRRRLMGGGCVELDDQNQEIQLASGDRDIVDELVMAEQVNGLLMQLPPAFREVLLAHEAHGFSYEEVAAKLGFSKFTVEIYLKQAKAKLREGREKQPGHVWREAKPGKRRRGAVKRALSIKAPSD